MDALDKQILQEVKVMNKVLSNTLIFLLAREGYSDPQIRAIFGKMDNNRIRQVSTGLKNKKK
jgi:hypothetical protein